MFKKFILLPSVVISVLLTIYLGYGIYKNSIERTQIIDVMKRVHQAAAIEKSIQSQKERANSSQDKEIKTIEDPYTIELEALGFKLKMINESTWNGIFKICFLWGFVLSSLIVYRRFTIK